MSEIEVVYVTDPEEQRRVRSEVESVLKRQKELLKRAGAKSAEGFFFENGLPRAIEE